MGSPLVSRDRELDRDTVQLSSFGVICAGAWYGALAWLIYAICETVWVGIVAWLMQPTDVYQPLHFGFTAALLVLYPLVGAILTLVVGLPGVALMRRLKGSPIDPRRLLSAVATSTVLVAFTLELLSRGFGLRSFALTALAGILVVAALARLTSSAMNRQLAFIGNPWTAVLLMLGLNLLPRYMELARVLELALTGFYVVAILSISYVLARALVRDDSALRPSALELYIVTGSAILVLGFTFAFIRGYYYVDFPQTASVSNAVNRPNVLLIVLDTVRADHTSIYGYERDTTPNLKKLAEQAVVFDHVVSPSDWTLPSHASLFTGLYISEHGAYCQPNGGFGTLDPDKTTLAETLSNAGYQTAGVVANGTVQLDSFNLPKGFQYFAVREPAPPLSYHPHYVLRRRVASIIEGLLPPEPHPKVYRDANEISGEAIAVLEDLSESENPFFLFLNYMDAHMPYDPPAPYANKYSNHSLMPTTEYRKLREDVQALKKEVGEDVREQLVAHYDSGIEYADAELGRLFDFMKRRKLFDNTIIIVTSDHGEAFGEHRTLEHGTTLYDEQIGIPLLIKTAQAATGQRSPIVASGVDVMPTVLVELGIKVPDGLSGRNLLSPDAAARNFVFSESFPCEGVRASHPRFNHVTQAVRSGSWKLIESSAGERELYDLETDPFELTDQSDSDKQLGGVLAATLNSYRDGVQSTRTRAPAKLDRKAIEKLKKLGYIQ